MTDSITALQYARAIIDHELADDEGRKTEWLPIIDHLMDYARENDKRPAYLKVAVPDEFVSNLAGRPQLRDGFIVLRVPLETIQKVRKGLEGEP